jgi:hypothetical protein
VDLVPLQQRSSRAAGKRVCKSPPVQHEVPGCRLPSVKPGDTCRRYLPFCDRTGGLVGAAPVVLVAYYCHYLLHDDTSMCMAA